jgi:hypothetical protein
MGKTIPSSRIDSIDRRRTRKNKAILIFMMNQLAKGEVKPL